MAPLRAVAAATIVLAGCAPGAAPAPTAGRVIGSSGTSLGRFRQPRAVAVSAETGEVYVADRTGRIQRFDARGEPLGQWRIPEWDFGQPVGLAVESGGSVLVNDSHYHRILRYSPDGSRRLASWGTKGSGPGQFTFGRDVVVDSLGCIYAGDYGGDRDRIQKFAPDGSFVLEWGGNGEEPGKFRRPQGMAVEARDGEERILVADAANHRVQRFSTDGRWISAFGRQGTGPGEMRYPYSVAASADGSVLVCEWGNHRIQRFGPSGEPLGTWGKAGHGPGELAFPWDIALTPGGEVVVADCDNHRLQAFRWPGTGLVATARPARPTSLVPEEAAAPAPRTR